MRIDILLLIIIIMLLAILFGRRELESFSYEPYVDTIVYSVERI